MEISRPRNYSEDTETVYENLIDVLLESDAATECFESIRVSDDDGYPVLKVRHTDGTVHRYKVQLTEVL